MRTADMKTESINCPHCLSEIPVTEAVAHSIREELKTEFDLKMKQEQRAFADREQKLIAEKKAVELARAAVNTEIEKRLLEEKARLLSQAREQIQGQMGLE